MTLPARIPKQRNRSDRWRSLAHCTFVRSHRCVVPGCMDMPIEVAHLREGTDAGLGRKPSDFFTVSMCRDHHAEQHRIGESPFGRLYQIDLWDLAAEFASASPKATEIRHNKRERGL